MLLQKRSFGIRDEIPEPLGYREVEASLVDLEAGYFGPVKERPMRFARS